MRKAVSIILMLLCSLPTSLYADDGPPSGVSGLGIAMAAMAHIENFSPKTIGVCIWKHAGLIPWITVTPELDEYLPDMVVSVYNEAGDDPFDEARYLFDDEAQAIGAAQMSAVSGGDQLTDGRNSGINSVLHSSADITKSADVIGSPVNMAHLPYMVLRRDTTSYTPYFHSATDSVMGRLGIAEDLELLTFSLLGPYVGKSFEDHWTYEFPRDMSVVNANDYKASASIALHAADIVTNRHTGHVVKGTNDSCGINCAVANVVPAEEVKKGRNPHEIWQEVYPLDKNKLNLGKSDQLAISPTGLGHDDEVAGHGNYVFLIWRHYKGCIQSHDATLLSATVTVPPTKKR